MPPRSNANFCGTYAAETEDGDDSALYRKLVADGIFMPEELGRHYGLSGEEIDALSKPLPSRVSIDKELADNRQKWGHVLRRPRNY